MADYIPNNTACAILISVLSLSFLISSASASTISVIDNADGTVSVTVDSTADGVNMAALALDIDVDGGAVVTAVSIDDTPNFNIYPDAAYSQEFGAGYIYGTGTPVCHKTVPGEISLPQSSFALCFACLSGQTTPGADGAQVVEFTLTFDAIPTGIEICENAKRGGIVAVDGTPLEAACIIIEPPYSCKGDNDYDSDIDLNDLSAMVGVLGPAAPAYNVSAAGHLALDFDDGDLDLNDLNAMVTILGPAAPRYTVPCP